MNNFYFFNNNNRVTRTMRIIFAIMLHLDEACKDSSK